MTRSREFRSRHDRALGSIRGPPGPGRAAGRPRGDGRRGGLRLRGLRPPVTGRLRRRRAPSRPGSWQPSATRSATRRIDVVAIYSSEELVASDPEFQAAVEQVVAGIRRGHHGAGHPLLRGAGRRRPGQRGRALRAGADLAGRGEPGRLPDQLRRAGAARSRPRAPGCDTDLAGAFAVFNDVNEITSEDLARAETISMPIVLTPGAADLRQPRRRVDAGPRRPDRDGRRPGRWCA